MKARISPMNTRYTLAVALAFGGLSFAVVSGRQAPGDKAWTTYGGHADSSRFFDSKQINKNNVKQLQVAWTYPQGETVDSGRTRGRKA